MKCLFVSDLHGDERRYEILFKTIKKEKPDGVFLGGDLLPSGFGMVHDIDEFVTKYLIKSILEVKKLNKEISIT